ncbi:MAG: ROK family protein [Akkermansiaceae bacterium]|nr:ROK family protein [Akkermansiaceae bacterium]
MNGEPLTIGIDFGGTSVKLAVVFQSHIIDHAPPIATQEFDGHDELISEIVRAIEDLRARHPKIAAVGVGMPGFVDFEKGLVINLTNVRGWAEVPLKKILEEKIGLPVWVDNDANCMAIAEWKCGAGRGFRHVLFVSLGTGVGGGVIANGQMIRGACYGAGEFGQSSIDYQGLPGNYGNLGALEKYVGNREITASAHAAYAAVGILKSLDDCSPAALAAAAHQGDLIASDQWNEIGRKLATAVMNGCWLLNPEAIVIGGGVARAGALLLEPFKKYLFAQLSGNFKDQLRIMPAAFGHEAGVIGAAALARDFLVEGE